MALGRPPSGDGVWDAFERTAYRTRQHPALSDAESSLRLSYWDALCTAVGVSDTLQHQKPTAYVVHMPTSANAVIVYLAVLRTGAMIVPLNSKADGRDRVCQVVSHLRAVSQAPMVRVISTDRDIVEHCCPALSVGAELVPEALADLVKQYQRKLDPAEFILAPRREVFSPSSLAFGFFTSGTTGLPKLVLDTQANVLDNIQRYTKLYHFSPSDVMVVVQSFAFSGVVSTIFGALLNGAQLCVLDVARRGVEALMGHIESEGVTVLHAVPSLLVRTLQYMRDGAELRVRLVRIEGDLCQKQDALYIRKKLPECDIYCGYGCSECGLVASYKVGRGADDLPRHTAVVPVGAAVGRTTITICDDDGVEQPLGQTGHVWIYSAHLSPGYYYDVQNTALRFRKGAHGLAYVSGDIGYQYESQDGERSLVLVGRSGDVGKVKGMWVPTEKMEATLQQLPGVFQAHISVAVDGVYGARVHAYLLPAPCATKEAALLSQQQQLAALRDCVPSLPPAQSMQILLLDADIPITFLPVKYKWIAGLRYTRMGKLDKGASFAPENSVDVCFRVPSIADFPPGVDREDSPSGMSDIEVFALARELWANALRMEPTDRLESNFFEEGGDSLALQALQRSARDDHSIVFSLRKLLACPNLGMFMFLLCNARRRCTAQSGAEAAGGSSISSLRSVSGDRASATQSGIAIACAGDDEMNAAYLMHFTISLPYNSNVAHCAKVLRHDLFHQECFRAAFHLRPDAVRMSLCDDAALEVEVQKRVKIVSAVSKPRPFLDAALAHIRVGAPCMFYFEVCLNKTATFLDMSAEGDFVIQGAVHHLIMDGVSLEMMASRLIRSSGVEKKDKKMTALEKKEDSQCINGGHSSLHLGLSAYNAQCNQLMQELKGRMKPIVSAATGYGKTSGAEATMMHDLLASCKAIRVMMEDQGLSPDSSVAESSTAVHAAKTISKRVSPETYLAVKRYCYQTSSSEFSFLLSALLLILRRAFLNENFAIATPVSLREALGIADGALGSHVELCVVPSLVPASSPFSAFHLSVREVLSLLVSAQDALAQRVLCKNNAKLQQLWLAASNIIFTHLDCTRTELYATPMYRRHACPRTVCDLAVSTKVVMAGAAPAREAVLVVELEYNADALHNDLAQGIVDAYLNVIENVSVHRDDTPALAMKAQVTGMTDALASLSRSTLFPFGAVVATQGREEDGGEAIPCCSAALSPSATTTTISTTAFPSLTTTTASSAPFKSPFDYFYHSYERFPDRAALVRVLEDGSECSLTYATVMHATSVLREALLPFMTENRTAASWPMEDESRCTPDNYFFLCLADPLQQHIAVLAVLSLGAAFVPLDESRAGTIAEEIRAAACIIDESTLPGAVVATMPSALDFVSMNALGLTADLLLSLPSTTALSSSPVHPHASAYVLYTSGSTGKPKGVVVEHCNLASLIEQEKALFGVREGGARVLCLFSYMFDAFYEQMFLALASGGALVVPHSKLDVLTRASMRSFIRAHEIDTITTTPVVLEKLRGPDLAGVTTLISGGESLSEDVAEELTRDDGMRFFNTYGPTETTIIATAWEIKGTSRPSARARTRTGIVPLGRALPGYAIAVLDLARRPLPPHLPGQLWITGTGLTRGYVRGKDGAQPTGEVAPLAVPISLMSPDSTADAADETSPCSWYPSGDIVFLDAQGEVHYVRRADDQAKLRGFRITTGEVRRAVRGVRGVTEAVAFVAGQPRRLYAAYVAEERVPPDFMLSRLRETLPSWSVPSQVVQLERIPLTVSSKTDTAAILRCIEEEEAAAAAVAAARGDNGIRGRSGDADLTAPNSRGEQSLSTLLSLFQSASPSGVTVALDTDLRGLSLDSLAVASLMEQFRETFSAKIRFYDYSSCRTVRDLAAFLFGGSPAEVAVGPPVSPPHKSDRGVYSDANWSPTSREQQWFWTLDQLSKQDSFQNAVTCADCLALRGPVVVDDLVRAWHLVFEKHAILRTQIQLLSGRLMQRPCPASVRPLHIAVESQDLGDAVEAARASLSSHCEALLQAPQWDLALGLVVAISIIRDPGADCTYMFTRAHHIVCDDMSLRSLYREVFALYAAFASGECAVECGSLGCTYLEYARWQQSQRARGEEHYQQDATIAYWRSELKDAPAQSTFPSRRKVAAPSRGTEASYTLSAPLSAQSAAAARRICERTGATLFAAYLTAYLIVLCRYAGQWDVVVGVPVSTRPVTTCRDTIGCFVNTLPFRAVLEPTMRWDEAVRAVHDKIMQAMDHVTAPLGDIVRAVARDGGDTSAAMSLPEPMFQTLFTFESALDGDIVVHSTGGGKEDNGKEGATEGLRAYTHPLQMHMHTIFDALFQVQAEVVTARCSARFDRPQMECLIQVFDHVLAQCDADPATPLAHLPMRDASEDAALFAWLGKNPCLRGPHASDSVRTLTDVVDVWSEREPERPATFWRGEQLSYRQLQRGAWAVAAALLQMIGVGDGGGGNGDCGDGTASVDDLPEADMWRVPVPPVAVMVPKSFLQPIAFMGVLYACRPFMVCEDSMPASRVAYMMRKTSVAAIVTHSALAGTLKDVRKELQAQAHRKGKPAVPECPAVFVDQVVGDSFPARAGVNVDLAPPPERRPLPESLAYILFTSGSTGKPKGVMIAHRSALNTCVDFNGRFELDHMARSLNVSRLSFDLSIYDFFGIWECGGSVAIPPDDSYQPQEWIDLVLRHNVAVWNTVPSLANLLFVYWKRHGKGAPLTSVRLAFLSGDWIPPNLPCKLREMFPNARICSGGGATEVSVWSVYYPIEEIKAHWTSIPYGRALGNQMIYILDDALRPCPVGVPGDIYYAGVGVARGYANSKRKTHGAFLRHPRTGERLYRAGDRGRVLADGNVEFLGRLDFQKKLNGLRLEMGEIESVVGRSSGVEDCCCDIASKDAPAAAQEEPDGNSDSGKQYLVAYVVRRNAATPQQQNELRASAVDLVSAKDLQWLCESQLPGYMVPSVFVFLDSLPISANGKVDRNSLPSPWDCGCVIARPARERDEPDDLANESEGEGSADGVDRRIEQLVLEVFRSTHGESAWSEDDSVSPASHICQLQPSSMEVILIASELSTGLGVSFKPKDLLACKTLREVERRLAQLVQEKSAVIDVPPLLQASPASERAQPQPAECCVPTAKPPCSAAPTGATAAESSSRACVYPCSPVQEAMLAASAASAALYVVTRVFACSRAVSAPAFFYAASAVAYHRPELRTQFCALPSGQYVQFVCSWEEMIASTLFLHHADPGEALEAFAGRMASTCAVDRVANFGFFSVKDGPPFVVMALHHAIVDDWSIDLLVADLERALADAKHLVVACGAECMADPRAILDDESGAFAEWVQAMCQSVPTRYCDELQRRKASSRTFFEHCESAGSPEGVRARNESLKFWKTALDGLEVRLNTPYIASPLNGAREEGKQEGASIAFCLSSHAWDNARALTEEMECTEFVLFLAVFHMLLHRVSGQDDVITAVPVSTRAHGLRNAIGCFLNSLPFFSSGLSNPAATFVAVVRSLEAERAAILGHREVSLKAILQTVAQTRRAPQEDGTSVQVMFVYLPKRRVEAAAATATAEEGDKSGSRTALCNVTDDVFAVHTAKFPLTLTQFNEPAFEIEFNVGIVKEEHVRLLASMYNTLLEHLQADARIGSVPLVPSPAPLLEGSPAVRADHFADKRATSFLHRLKEQAQLHPQQPAVRDDGRMYAYSELWHAVAAVAARICAAEGREPGQEGGYVAIMLPRSFAYVAAFVGAMAAGCIATPLDPHAPVEQLRQVLQETGSTTVVCSDGAWSRLQAADVDADWDAASLRRISVADVAPIQSAVASEVELPAVAQLQKRPAYCIFTSGSTGAPKGVVIAHHSLDLYLRYAAETYMSCSAAAPSSFRATPFYTACTFDFSITSMCAPLICGGLVDIIQDDPESLTAFFREVLFRSYYFVKLTPGHLSMLSYHSTPPLCDETGCAGRDSLTAHIRVGCLVIGGEELTPCQLAALEASLGESGFVDVYNEYGPTEATVGCVVHCVRVGRGRAPSQRSVAAMAAIPIGMPIPGTIAFVLNPHLQHQPEGVEGDLYLGGDNLLSGYVSNRSVEDPCVHVDGQRMYKSGDRARWSGGVLEYLGRTGSVVKLAGYRVNLQAIQSIAMATSAEVSSCVVFVPDTVPRALHCAVFCEAAAESSRSGPELVQRIRKALRRKLPAYMTPTDIYVMYDNVPLNRHGKVDIQRVAEMQAERAVSCGTELLDNCGSGESNGATDDGDVAENSGCTVTEVVRTVWQQVLGRATIQNHANWYSLGGDSITWLYMMSQLRRELQEKFGVALNTHETGGLRSVAQFVEHLRPLLLEAAHGGSAEGDARVRWALPSRAEALDRLSALVPLDSTLTPMAVWFFQQRWLNRNFYVQYRLFDTVVPFAAAEVSSAWCSVVAAHPEMRRSFEVRLPNTRDGYGVGVTEWQLPHLPIHCHVRPSRGSSACFETIVVPLQQPLNASMPRFPPPSEWSGRLCVQLEAGVLSNIVLFTNERGVRHVLVLLHHLAVDAVSWEVYVRDFNSALNRFREGYMQTRLLPPASDPAAGDCEDSSWHLLSFALDSAKLKLETRYWKFVASEWCNSGWHFLTESAKSEQPHADVRSGWKLSRLHVRRVAVPLAQAVFLLAGGMGLGVTLYDMVLSVVLRAIRSVTGDARACLYLESYGRPTLFRDVENAEYGGWHTSVFPFSIAMDEDKESFASLVRRVSVCRQRVPNQGVGFGVLKYLLQHRAFQAVHSDVWLNFLGSDKDVGGMTDAHALVASTRNLPSLDLFPRGHWDPAMYLNLWHDERTCTLQMEIAYCSRRCNASRVSHFEQALLQSCRNVENEIFPSVPVLGRPAFPLGGRAVSDALLCALPPLSMQQWGWSCTRECVPLYWIHHVYRLQTTALDLPQTLALDCFVEALYRVHCEEPILRAHLLEEEGGALSVVLPSALPSKPRVIRADSETDVFQYLDQQREILYERVRQARASRRTTSSSSSTTTPAAPSSSCGSCPTVPSSTPISATSLSSSSSCSAPASPPLRSASSSSLSSILMQESLKESPYSWEFTVLSVGDRIYLLSRTHHALSDGRCMFLMLKRVQAKFEEIVADLVPVGDSRAVSPVEWDVVERNFRENFGKVGRMYVEQLADSITLEERARRHYDGVLPPSYFCSWVPPQNSSTGCDLSCESVLGGATFRALGRVASGWGVSQWTLLLSAWAVCLRRLRTLHDSPDPDLVVFYNYHSGRRIVHENLSLCWPMAVVLPIVVRFEEIGTSAPVHRRVVQAVSDQMENNSLLGSYCSPSLWAHLRAESCCAVENFGFDVEPPSDDASTDGAEANDGCDDGKNNDRAAEGSNFAAAMNDDNSAATTDDSAAAQPRTPDPFASDLLSLCRTSEPSPFPLNLVIFPLDQGVRILIQYHNHADWRTSPESILSMLLDVIHGLVQERTWQNS